ncbi:MAG TPA: type II toxin-antitoxin system antitoxin SocA domain-containing protein [Verrucomicrobiae bacterium]|jgi:uncharacterized phage-associated protein|nr:type II toxin-antitoxin system antitoxin SocA domain-containing protein [Verrucomicrobiae bacterium]
MATVHDIASYILKKHGPTTAMKLQKLAYYCQAWSLVWDERPIFAARIEAWANGPVIPALYSKHKGRFEIKDWHWGDADALNKDQRETVDAVIDFYGPKTAQWLSDLTHREAPWRDARVGLEDGERGGNEISLASLHEYYSSL